MTAENKSNQDFNIRTAMAVLPEIRQGKMIKDLTKICAEVAMAVVVHQDKGEITLKLKFAPGPGTRNAIAIVDDIKVKMPQEEKRATVLFANDDGSLTREDPLQPELGLNVVPAQRVKQTQA